MPRETPPMMLLDLSSLDDRNAVTKRATDTLTDMDEANFMAFMATMARSITESSAIVKGGGEDAMLANAHVVTCLYAVAFATLVRDHGVTLEGGG